MLEIKNMFQPNEEIFKNLQTYIKENASVETWVGRNRTQNKNPIIVFQEARNELQTRSTTNDNTTRFLNYNINIYCSHNVNSYDIIKELVVLVTNVMQGYYRMQGGLIAILPNFDGKDKIGYQANLRFSTRFIPSELKLY